MPIPVLPPAGVDWMPNTSDLTPPPAAHFPTVIPNIGERVLNWFDFSGWLDQFYAQPGPVILNPQKGKPVPAPGNPASEGGSQTSGIAGQVSEGIQSALSIFIPSPGQKRDMAVYGLALIVFVIAVAAMLR